MNLFFLTGYDDPFIRLSYAQLLQQGHQCAGFASYQHDEPDASFKNSKILNGSLLYKPETVAEAFKGTEPTVLSAHDIKHFISTKDTFIRTVDRCTLRPLPVRFHLTLFREILRYSLGFLYSAQPNAIICESTPHFGWEIIFAAAAKRLGIPTLFIKRTLIQNRIAIHLDADEDIAGHLAQHEYATRATHIHDASDESTWERHSARINKLAKQDLTTSNLYTFFRYHLKTINQATKKAFSPILSNTIRFKKFVLFYEYAKQFLKVKKLRKHYKSLSCGIDSYDNFIFFPMHFQPERSTQPEGGWYEDQFLAAAQVADALPPGYKLYIKEHPRQLIQEKIDIRQKHYRSTYDYDALSRLPNTKLIDWRIDNLEIIKKSKACVTITGSSGWEALQMGIPAVTFGETWYTNCFGCFLANESLDVATALQKSLSLAHRDIAAAAKRFRNLVHETYTVATNASMFLPSPSHHTDFARNLSAAFQKQLARLKQR
jgi:hypothetical protein